MAAVGRTGGGVSFTVYDPRPPCIKIDERALRVEYVGVLPEGSAEPFKEYIVREGLMQEYSPIDVVSYRHIMVEINDMATHGLLIRQPHESYYTSLRIFDRRLDCNISLRQLASASGQDDTAVPPCSPQEPRPQANTPVKFIR